MEGGRKPAIILSEQGCQSPNPPSWAGSRPKRSRSAGRKESVATTTSWSRGCGERSSTRRCIHMTTAKAGKPKSAWPASHGAAIQSMSHCRECLAQGTLTVGPGHGAQVLAHMPHRALHTQRVDLREGVNASLFQALDDAGANARRGQQQSAFIGGKASCRGLGIDAGGEDAARVKLLVASSMQPTAAYLSCSGGRPRPSRARG